MNEIRERAYAKLNISLDVLGTRPDNYHEMKTVMLSVSLYDELLIRLTRDGACRVHSNLRYLPCDERNIACKAAKAFFAELGESGRGVEIHMKKRVPVCAGMGGGSSDGAAVLRALNRLTGAGFSAKKLEDMARPLGSDIPFCVSGGTQLATGRGDELLRLPEFPDCRIVICKPPFSISTPVLFSRIDSRSSPVHPDTDGILSAIENGDLRGIAGRLYNVFEDVLTPKYASIASIKSRMLSLGALGAAMSGTGSGLFGIFEDARTADRAREALRESYKECYVARPTGRIAISGVK